MPHPLDVAFVAGPRGAWHVDVMTVLCGAELGAADGVDIVEGPSAATLETAWVLRGTTSNTRYTNRAEMTNLAARQAGLSRPAATRAALIPIRKNAAWWDLAQDERRAIFEEQSHHIAIGLGTLPGVARRLHHCRELGEPFDFLTWFEFAPEHAADFDHMLDRLRATREWHYVEREVDIRLRR